MATARIGQIAVIFRSRRIDVDADAYARAAQAMDTLAADQPGYVGMHSVRGADGDGLTISYWTDETSAKGWRDHPDHVAIRNAGRDRWYSSYEVIVTRITRHYDWQARE